MGPGGWKPRQMPRNSQQTSTSRDVPGFNRLVSRPADDEVGVPWRKRTGRHPIIALHSQDTNSQKQSTEK